MAEQQLRGGTQTIPVPARASQAELNAWASGQGVWMRAGLGVLAAVALIVGGWQLLVPQGFFDFFPGFGRVWVSIDGPYNEHLLRDVGGLNIAFGLLLVWAAVTLRRSLVLPVLVAQIVIAVPHFVYHASTLTLFGSWGDKLEVLLALAVPLVLPGALLAGTVATRRGSPPPRGE